MRNAQGESDGADAGKRHRRDLVDSFGIPQLPGSRQGVSALAQALVAERPRSDGHRSPSAARWRADRARAPSAQQVRAYGGRSRVIGSGHAARC